MMRSINAVKLASVSLFALGLTLGAPAMAQQAPGTLPPPSPGAAPGTMPGQGMQQANIKQKLEQLGIKDQKAFKGHLATAQSAEGHPVLLVFGPENMQADKSVDFKQDEIRNKLTEGGFSNVNFVQDPQIIRGQLKEDAHVLAFTGKAANWRAQGQQAQGQTVQPDTFQKNLDQVGLDDSDKFEGRLLRSQAAGGDTIFILVGSKDFKGDKQVNLSAEDLNKFRQQGFQPVEAGQQVTMAHGKLDDARVIALAGAGLTGGGAGTAGMTTGAGATTSPGITGTGTTGRSGAGAPMGGPGAGSPMGGPGATGTAPGTTR